MFNAKQKKSGTFFSEIDLLRSICRDSFYEFLREFWDSIIPEKPVWNWHIKYLCDEMQIAAERVFAGKPKEYDLIINVPPGTTKSTIVSVAFPAWAWTRMPSARLICGSHTEALTFDLSRKCRNILEEADRSHGRPTYQDCFPGTELLADQNTKGHFVNQAGGGRKSITVGGASPTGFHAHFLIVDDPIDPQQAAAISGAEMKAANTWMQETLPSRKVDKEVTLTVLLMQRLHQLDPTGFRLALGPKAGPIKHISLPADLQDGYEPNPPELREYYVDDLLDPVRLSRHVLAEQRTLLGTYGYAGQYGQNPTPRGGGIFKADRFEIGICPFDRITKITRYWDKAATEGAGKYTCGVKMGVEMRAGQPHYWVLDVRRERLSTDRRERMIQQTAQMDGRRCRIVVEGEPGSGGKDSALWTVRNLAGYIVSIDPARRDKMSRAEPLSTQVNVGNVSLHRASWNHDYIEEFRSFPVGAFMDQVDASSGCFNKITQRRVIGGF